MENGEVEEEEKELQMEKEQEETEEMRMDANNKKDKVIQITRATTEGKRKKEGKRKGGDHY